MGITKKQLEDVLIFTPEELEQLAEEMQNKIDQPASVKLASKIADLSRIPENVEVDFTHFDRIVWVIRNAYITGYMEAAYDFNNSITSVLDRMFY